jgi:DNA-binding phage protein
MGLTRSFRETVRARAVADEAFRRALLAEAVELFLTGDVQMGKAVLRDTINATVGFDALGRETGLPPKSLMRMLGTKGNPRAENIFSVIRHLQAMIGVQLAVQAKAA